MTARTPIVGGNWKMNTDADGALTLAAEVTAGLTELDPGAVEVVLCPPHPWLVTVTEAVSGIGGALVPAIGGQDCSPHESGAHTGQVSAAMLAAAGARWAIVGHSERRHELGESDELVGGKLARVLAGGLRAILCVGELEDERASGRTEAVVGRQLDAALAAMDGLPAPPDPADLVIAYEPVWAIGTGRTAGPEDAQAVHGFVRERLASRYDDAFAGAVRLQYGGSVKPGNAADLFAGPDVDGFLVGGASLDAGDFLAIVDATRGG